MEQFVTLKRAAKRYQVSERHLRRLEKRGLLRLLRLGRAVRVSVQELERLSQR
jgi:excisionase family DNA binding protein